MTLSGLVDRYQHFPETGQMYLHTSPHSITTHKDNSTTLFIPMSGDAQQSHTVVPALMSGDTCLMVINLFQYPCSIYRQSFQLFVMCTLIHCKCGGFQSKPLSFIFALLVFRDRNANICNFAEKIQSGLLAKLEKKSEWKGLTVHLPESLLK
jgi:hypothetical protein